jgi:hypothetical protein
LSVSSHFHPLSPPPGSWFYGGDNYSDAGGLEGDPARVLSSPVRMKFFFHSSSEARYAEVFTNIDVQAGRLEFHEKDPSYRVALVRALTEA